MAPEGADLDKVADPGTLPVLPALAAPIPSVAANATPNMQTEVRFMTNTPKWIVAIHGGTSAAEDRPMQRMPDGVLPGKRQRFGPASNISVSPRTPTTSVSQWLRAY